MKLYDVPRHSYIRILPTTDVAIPPVSKQIVSDDELFFRGVDGMYSFCIDKDGEIVHVGATTEVEVLPVERVEMVRKEILKNNPKWKSLLDLS